MALYEKNWWKKLFRGKEYHDKTNVLNDIQAVKEFLQDINAEVTRLTSNLKKLEELETEFEMVGSEQLKKVNLQTQADLMEHLLESYASFENDVDINGLRVKWIATNFLKKAQRAGLAELVNEKKQNPKWKFFW